MLEPFAEILIGFSVIVSAVLFAAYALFLDHVNKSPKALVTGALLLLSLAQLQLWHGQFLTHGGDPMAAPGYRLWLFLAPPMFYLFSRTVLFDDDALRPALLLHLVPIALPFLIPLEIAVAILFCIGTGYSLWLTRVIYTLASLRPRSRFELFFLVLFSAMALGVLALGFSLPYIPAAYFYLFYTYAIGLALVLVTGALLSFPELLTEIAEVARASYAASTLNGIDVDAKKSALERAMTLDKVYQDETLSLKRLADAIELTPHQLSELINTEYRVSFSRYVREHRIEEAIRLLKAEPDSSVLSISLQVGFKSQSNFYAAFKEITGQSPGAYRA